MKRLRLIRFITIGKNAGISALGIVGTRPRLHGWSQGSLLLTPVDQDGVEHTSSETVSYRLPIRSVSWWARAPTSPLTACWIANGMLFCGRSRLHSKGHEAPNSTRDAVSLRNLQPPICLLPPWGSQWLQVKLSTAAAPRW